MLIIGYYGLFGYISVFHYYCDSHAERQLPHFSPFLALINTIKHNVNRWCCLGQNLSCPRKLWKYNITFEWPFFFFWGEQMSIGYITNSMGSVEACCFVIWWESPFIWIQSHLLRCGAHGHFDVITLSWLSTKVVNHVYKIHPTGSSACPGGSRRAPGGRGLWEGPLLQGDTEQHWARAASGGSDR